MNCKNCGHDIDDNARVCPHCGVGVSENIKKPRNTTAIVGFVFSFIIYFSLVGLIISVIALGKSKEMNGAGKKLAIAGIIISIAAMILFSIFVVWSMGALMRGLIVVI